MLFACSGSDKRQCKDCNPFGSRGHTFNKPGRGPLTDAIYQISKL